MKNIKLALFSLVVLPLMFPSYTGGGSDQIKGLVEEFMDRIYSSCTLGLYDKEVKEKPVEVQCTARGIAFEEIYDKQNRSRHVIVSDKVYIQYRFQKGTSYVDSGRENTVQKEEKPGKPTENVIFTISKGESIFCGALVFVNGGAGGKDIVQQLTWDEAYSKSKYYADKDKLLCTHEFNFYIKPGVTIPGQP